MSDDEKPGGGDERSAHTTARSQAAARRLAGGRSALGRNNTTGQNTLPAPTGSQPVSEPISSPNPISSNPSSPKTPSSNPPISSNPDATAVRDDVRSGGSGHGTAFRYCRLGSVRSRSQSPIVLIDSVRMKIATPGSVAIHHDVTM